MSAPNVIELLFEVPEMEDDLKPAIVAVGVELMFARDIQQEKTMKSAVQPSAPVITHRSNSIAAYAIRGYNSNLPIHAIATFGSVEEFMSQIKPAKNGERTQLAIGDSIKIITGRFVDGNWTWTGV